MMRAGRGFCWIALLHGAVTVALKSVLSDVFHPAVLEAHDWSSLDLDALSDEVDSSYKSIYLTCGRHDAHTERLVKLSEAFGEENVDFASVDQGGGKACFIVHGDGKVMDELSE